MERGSPHRPWRWRTLTVMVLATTLIGSSGLWPLPAQARVFFGTFSIFCGLSHRNHDDPIVYPRKPGRAHLHQFFGSRDTNAFSTIETMRKAGTTCGFSPDTAGYWVPALKNRSGHVVRPNRLSSYYRGGLKTQPFPPGLKVIAGGNTRNLQKAGWTCGEGLPDFSRPRDCGNRQLKAVVVFPSCWDGRRKDSTNHRAHMSYREAGKCPSHHPVEVPRIVLHILYPVSDGTGFRLSSDEGGDKGGTTLHADFWNTWDQLALKRAVRNCINELRTCKLGR
jgi:hypothetical protein